MAFQLEGDDYKIQNGRPKLILKLRINCFMLFIFLKSIDLIESYYTFACIHRTEFL